MITQKQVFAWLLTDTRESADKRYRHRVIKELPSKREQITGELTTYIQRAHDDARKRLRKLGQISLDPLESLSSPDPAEGYPERLHLQTLKGYFGEIFAGLVAEYFSPFGINNWKIPAYLFRFHLTEFQQLEYMRQTGEQAHIRPGRTGDDCLAFQMDKEGQILRSLYCEAKCTADHNTDMIADAHEKVSKSVIVDYAQLIEVLQDSEDSDAVQWITALRQLWLGKPNADYERYDLVSYVCRPPIRKEYWLPMSEPHPKYTAKRKLEAVEVYLPKVEDLVRTVYSKVEEDEGDLDRTVYAVKEATHDSFK